jgi:hypothetical protein
MKAAGRLALCGLALAVGSVAAVAQSLVISARSGLIHYVEGTVYVGDQQVESKFGAFPEVKEKQILRTEEGRAEVLLTPGVFLRLGEHSSFRMITNRLIDTRLEFLGGSAIIEADDIGKDNSITVAYKDATIHPIKKGLYRLDSSPAQLKVFNGEADVMLDDKTIEAKDGHLVELETLAMRKFDRNETDALNRWSERRGEYVSMASVSAANTLRTSMFDGGGMLTSGWYWNQYMGMYSFVPGLDGNWFSAYGYPFWSPFNVYQAYMPGYYYYPYSYYGGYYGGFAPGYAGAYNTVSTRSVPVPSHSGSVGSGGSGSVASGHAPTVGGAGGYAYSGGTLSSAGISTPAAHAGGSVGGGSVGGGSVGGGGGGHH